MKVKPRHLLFALVAAVVLILMPFLRSCGTSLLLSHNIESAYRSEDVGEVLRVFRGAIYGRWSDAQDSAPTVRQFLSHSDPYIRYLAAETLLTIGDDSGVPILIELVEESDPRIRYKEDVRFVAARLLGEFRIADGISAITDLYGRTKEAKLLSYLAMLGAEAPTAGKLPYVPKAEVLIEYSLAGNSTYLPKIEKTFHSTDDLEVKTAAAWALARAGKVGYVDFLIEVATPALVMSSSGTLSYDVSSNAVRLLGSIRSPQVEEFLIGALSSENQVVVRYAVVNLLFNQDGGHEEALELLIRELDGVPKILGSDLTYKLAARFLDNERVVTAGEGLQERSSGRSWSNKVVKRKDWSIYNWIDEYVVVLNSDIEEGE